MPKEFISEFTHTLHSPVSYAKGPELEEARLLVVKAPNNHISHLVSIIETELNKATFEVSMRVNADKDKRDELEKASKDSKPQEETEEDKHNTIYTILSAHGDMAKCLVAFKQIMTYERAGKAMALLDGTTHLTAPLYDDIATIDTRELLVKYIANFLNTSLTG